MVKIGWAVCMIGLALAAAAQAQDLSGLERRVVELEHKMRQLDPSFQAPETDLLARIEALERRMELLLAARPAPPAADSPPSAAAPGAAQPPPAPAARVPVTPLPLQPVSVSGDYQASGQGETRLPVAGYMDFHFNKDRGDSFRPDLHRFVLLFGHSFSDRIKFWSELEVEHAFIEGGEESGEVAVEQAYLDFLGTPYLNFRGGMLLTPVGIINERHEPPSFNGVERPFVESIIIPSTWRELGFGLTGDLGRGFRYRTYMISALDAGRFNAEFGIAEGRTAGFDASFRNPATVGRLEYAGVRRLTLGTSVYTGNAGFNTPGVAPRVTLLEFDGRYSFRRFDFRGLFADTWISDAGQLNQFLERETGVNPNVASRLRGYYFEPAVHLLPRRLRSDLIAFARYESYDTQYRMPSGYVPLPQFDRWSWVTGVTFKPIPDVALKFDYVFNRNRSTVVQALDSINLGIGWWF